MVDGKLQQVPMVSKSLLDKLEVVLFHQNKKKEIQRQTTLFNDHIKKIFENQSRLRENIKSLEKILDSDLVRRYLKDLDRQEDDLNNTRKKIATLVEEEANINEQIKLLNLDISTITKKEIETLTNVRRTTIVEDDIMDFDSISDKKKTVSLSEKMDRKK